MTKFITRNDQIEERTEVFVERFTVDSVAWYAQAAGRSPIHIATVCSEGEIYLNDMPGLAHYGFKLINGRVAVRDKNSGVECF